MSQVFITTTVPEEVLVHFFEIRLPAILAGEEADSFGIRRHAMVRLAHAVLTTIHQDFIVKSRGMPGADGTVWARLTEMTLALRAKRRGISRSIGRLGMTADEVAEVVKSRRQLYNSIVEERRGSVGLNEARRQASLVAKAFARSVFAARAELARRGKSPSTAYASEEDAILIDSGRLLSSISPGTITGMGDGSSISPPVGHGTTDQVIDIDSRRGELSIYSSVPYGEKHQAGGTSTLTRSPVPRRPWKYPNEVIPDSWMDSWVGVYVNAIVEYMPAVIARLSV